MRVGSSMAPMRKNKLLQKPYSYQETKQDLQVSFWLYSPRPKWFNISLIFTDV